MLAWSRGGHAPAISVTVVAVLANLSWVVRDHTTPSFDQSHYLYMTWVYRHDLVWHGLHAMIHDIYTIDPGRGPMLSVLMVPIAFFTDAKPVTGLALNMILWPILLLSCGAIAAHFWGNRARWLAILMVAPMPLLVSLSHTTLQDFLVATLSATAIWLLLRTRLFTRPLASAGLGIVIAIGSLTKISFGLDLIIPLAVIWGAVGRNAYLARREVPIGQSIGRSALSVGLWAACTGIIPIIWFSQNWASTKSYLNAAFVKQPGVISNPLSYQHLGEFALSTINYAISWQFAIISVLVIVVSIFGRLRHPSEVRFSVPAVGRGVFLAAWVAVPMIAVAISDNHDARYAVSTFPAFGVIVGGMMSTIRFQLARRAIISVALIAAVTMTLQSESSRWRIPGLAPYYAVNTKFGYASLQLTRGLGPATNFMPTDYAAGVLDYLEKISRGPSGAVQPRQIALLQLHGAVNGNTMPYEATVRRLPFTFQTLFVGAETDLAAELKNYDYALYLSQPAADKEESFGRVAQLNDTAAAHHMTPALFALFQPNPTPVYVGLDSGQGDEMYVLVRKR